MTALRALLAGIIDYAGLFPPAGLEMSPAVHNYAAYRAADDAWMLGRFVVPAARLDELSEALVALGAQAAPEWRLTVVAGADAQADVERIREFTRRQRGSGRAHVDSIEAKLTSVEAIDRVALARDADSSLLVELPANADIEPLVAAIKRAKVNAKLRTGGVTEDSIPSPQSVVRLMRCCITAGIPFKATAGLHHPVRAEYPLTYEPGAPVGLMFGFLNVFLAAGFMRNGVSDADALELLDERDPAAFTFTPTTIRWRAAVLDETHIDELRSSVALSFGSCSFTEPVEELRRLALSS